MGGVLYEIGAGSAPAGHGQRGGKPSRHWPAKLALVEVLGSRAHGNPGKLRPALQVRCLEARILCLCQIFGHSADGPMTG